MPDAFTVLTLPTVGAAVIVGLIVGGVYLADVQHVSVADPIVLLMCGWAFFVLISVGRFADGALTWERNLGVGILWAVFCGSAWIGLRIRWRVRP